MTMEMKHIPIQTFKRLPNYYNYLSLINKNGTETISAPSIAKAMSLNEVQVRKDLAAVSECAGKPRTGFVVRELMKSIGDCLGYFNTEDAILVGTGQLGRALLSYSGFKDCGLHIVAAFDRDEAVIGLEKGGTPVMDITTLHKFCKRLNIRMGIITVPAEEAQNVCDLMVESGILAIWNFAPVHLTVPSYVLVLNENMAASLSILSKHLAKLDLETMK